MRICARNYTTIHTNQLAVFVIFYSMRICAQPYTPYRQWSHYLYERVVWSYAHMHTELHLHTIHTNQLAVFVPYFILCAYAHSLPHRDSGLIIHYIHMRGQWLYAHMRTELYLYNTHQPTGCFVIFYSMRICAQAGQWIEGNFQTQ